MKASQLLTPDLVTRLTDQWWSDQVYWVTGIYDGETRDETRIRVLLKVAQMSIV